MELNKMFNENEAGMMAESTNEDQIKIIQDILATCTLPVEFTTKYLFSNIILVAHNKQCAEISIQAEK